MMPKSNKVEEDLIKDLITELKKKPDLCVMTTFEFDMNFFENYLLKNLPKNTYLIIDRGMFDKINERPSSRFLSKMKNKIIYIDLLNGVFHPKITLLIKGGHGVVYVSSANITSKGYMRNEEFTIKFNEGYAINEVVDFLVKLLTKYGIGSASKQLIEKLKGIQINSTIPDNLLFVDNLYDPIFNYLVDILKSTSVREIYIVSPYIDNKFGYLVDFLSKWTDGARIYLVLQRNVNYYNSSIFIKDKITPVLGGEGDRFLHSKLIYFKGDKDMVLLGSANFTTKALLSSSEKGNVEFDVIVKLPEDGFKSYLEYLNLNKIEDVKDIHFKGIEENFSSREHALVNSCFYRDGKVYIEFIDNLSKSLKIKVFTDDNKLVSEIKYPNFKFENKDKYKLIILENLQLKSNRLYEVELSVNDIKNKVFFTTYEELIVPNVKDYSIQLISGEHTELWIPYIAIEQSYNHIIGKSIRKRYSTKQQFPLYTQGSINEKSTANILKRIIKRIRNIRIKEIESNIDPENNETNEIDDMALREISDLFELLLDSSVDLFDDKLPYEFRIELLWSILSELYELQRVHSQINETIITESDLCLWETYFLYMYTSILEEKRVNIRKEIIGGLMVKLNYIANDKSKFLDILKNNIQTATFEILMKKGVFDKLEKIFTEFELYKKISTTSS